MKKVIIALVLVSLIMVPVFAEDPESYTTVGGEASVKFAVGSEGIKVSGIGLSATFEKSFFAPRIRDLEALSLKAKLGYVFSISNDPAISGVYLDAFAQGQYAGLGLGLDFHKIDGVFKVNVAPEVRVEHEISGVTLGEGSFGPKMDVAVSARYVLLNNTGVAPFSFDVEAGFGAQYGEPV